MIRHRWVVCVLSCALAATGVPVFAQGSDRAALTGRVTDPSGAAIAGAAIRIESPALIGGPREIETDATGAYRLTDLTPGSYRLEARAPLFKTAVREGIRLEADARLVVDVPLDVASLAESVRVSETAPVVDVTSAEAPFRLSRALLANLPSHHVVSDILNLAPGVNVNVGLGGVQRSNPILIDGVNVTDAQSLAPWASYDYNWLEDVQIVGPGGGAQYGEFSGVLQKARLRSGGNRFSGLAELRLTRPSWADTNTSSLSTTLQSTFASRSAHILEWWDSSLQAGGPIRRDRVWFFAGLQRSRNDVRPALYAGEHSTDTRDRRVLIKLDAAPARSLRATGHYEDDRHAVAGGDLGPLTLFEATTTDAQPDHNWHARLGQMLGSSTALEAGDAGSRGTLSFNPTPPATRDGPYPHADGSTGLLSGNVPFYMDSGSVRHLVNLTVTHTRAGPRRSAHDLTAGIEQEWTRSDSVTGFPGGRSYVDLDGAPYYLYVQAEERLSTRVRRFTAFAADRWSVGERVTLEPGVRLSVNRGAASQGTVLTAHPLSPRLGVAWDLTAAHTTVLRAHYGRYHDAMLTAHVSTVDATPAKPLIEYEIGPAGQLTETWRSTASSFAADDHVRAPFFDQWTVGVERQLAAATSATVQYVGRIYRDAQGFVDRGSVYQPVVRTDPGPDGRLGTADDGGPLNVFRKTNPGEERYVFTNLRDVGRRLDALQIILRRQDTRSVDAQLSYTWSSTRGAAVNGLRSNSGGPDLGFNGVAADPNRAINADGPMPFDFTHELKALATWVVPRGGLRVSAVYQAHTGNAWGRTTQLSNLQQVIFGVRVEPRGTRRTPALNTLDLRLEKTLRLPRGATGSVFADVFNAGNQGIPDPSARRPLFEVSGPSFGQPLAWLPPRTLRVGARVTF